jgi:glycosidase
MLNWYKKLIALRRSNAVLHDGTMAMLDTGNPSIVAWNRIGPDGKVVLAACNFAATPQVFSMGSGKTATVLAVSGGEKKSTVDLKAVALPAYGSIVVEVN